MLNTCRHCQSAKIQKYGFTGNHVRRCQCVDWLSVQDTTPYQNQQETMTGQTITGIQE